MVHTKVCQTVRCEIAYPDCPDQAYPIQFLHRPPGTIVVTKRLMNQIEVQIVKPQFFKRSVERFFCIFISCLLDMPSLPQRAFNFGTWMERPCFCFLKSVSGMTYTVRKCRTPTSFCRKSSSHLQNWYAPPHCPCSSRP